MKRMVLGLIAAAAAMVVLTLAASGSASPASAPATRAESSSAPAQPRAAVPHRFAASEPISAASAPAASLPACIALFPVQQVVDLSGPAAAAAAALQAKLDSTFVVLTCPPFVIAGNLSREQLGGYAQDSIVGPAQAMYASFFDTRPDKVITVLLLADANTYHDSSLAATPRTASWARPRPCTPASSTRARIRSSRCCCWPMRILTTTGPSGSSAMPTSLITATTATPSARW